MDHSPPDWWKIARKKIPLAQRLRLMLHGMHMANKENLDGVNNRQENLL